MSYLFENLNDESFQHLCQALLVKEFPNIQCFPVNQPDGGRDAFSYLSSDESQNRSFVVFQIKFSRNPLDKDSRESVKSLVLQEKEKIQKLSARGAVKYYLITNIGGTSHLDSGSVDKVNMELSDIAGIDCQCWWRDDLDRRIDTHPQIKWSFPNILRATDLLQILVYNERSDKENEDRISTLKSYMSYQYSKDSQLKFKQIELHKNIADLFVDVPAHVQIPEDEKLRARWTKDISNDLRKIIVRPEGAHYNWLATDSGRYRGESPGAAFLLANKLFSQRFSKIVIEGAPGQGKSTVTQYLCQIHRMILLSKIYEIGRIPDEHKPDDVRIPFRIDLRDYASWLVGRDPFSADPEAKLPADTNPILESYIAAQIRRHTGQTFSVNDLASISKSSQILIVLDGFDEVADVPTRNKLVEEISEAAIRLESNALSLQIIVTSRPAAFANSPGFSRLEWQHVQLLSLSKDVIETYTKKWLDGRNADERERRDITSVLRDKIQQAHVRDLSRNPMQLAILLALVSIQGASLPDKRTALYDKYIDVFFNREAEKSQVVRDHRELLIRIQRYVAYKLQSAAETDGRSGSISEAELKDTIREYLISINSKKNIVDDLFTGLKERVGALVSRVQGTYEFEVQPLREYFSARYLYDTAPYSPAGSRRRGALPDRFEAIGCNAYWLNVTRFYAGCYSSGELASLVEGIESLNSKREIKFTAHIIQLPVIFLSDYIFDHNARLSSKVVDLVTKEPNITLLLAQQSNISVDRELNLPVESGQAELADACRDKLKSNNSIEDVITISRVLAINSSSSDSKAFWLGQNTNFVGLQSWITCGNVLGVYKELDATEINKLIQEYGADMRIELYKHGRLDDPLKEIEILKEVVEKSISGVTRYLFNNRNPEANRESSELVGILSFTLSYIYFEEMKVMHEKVCFKEVYHRYMPYYSHRSSKSKEGIVIPHIEIVPSTVADSVVKFSEEPLSTLLSSINRWDELISELCKIWGDAWAFVKLAITVANQVKDDSYKPSACNLLDSTYSLCNRIVFAKNSHNDKRWWKYELARTHSCGDFSKIIVIRTAIEYMSTDIIIEFSDNIGNLCDEIADDAWTALSNSIPVEQEGRGSARPRALRVPTSRMPNRMSPRLASLLSKRLNSRASNIISEKYLAAYAGNDEKIIEVILKHKIAKCISDEKMWIHTLSYIAYSYKAGIVDDLLRRHQERGVKIPIDAAILVCEQASRYPLGLVALAERTIAKHFGPSIEAVGKIAEREDWAFEG